MHLTIRSSSIDESCIDPRLYLGNPHISRNMVATLDAMITEVRKENRALSTELQFLFGQGYEVLTTTLGKAIQYQSWVAGMRDITREIDRGDYYFYHNQVAFDMGGFNPKEFVFLPKVMPDATKWYEVVIGPQCAKYSTKYLVPDTAWGEFTTMFNMYWHACQKVNFGVFDFSEE